MACTQLQRQHNMESGIEEHDMPRRGRGEEGGWAGWHGLGVTHMPQRFIGTAANNGLMWYKQPISLFFTLLKLSHWLRIRNMSEHCYLPHKCIALVLEHAYLLYCAIGREGLLQDVLIEKAR